MKEYLKVRIENNYDFYPDIINNKIAEIQKDYVIYQVIKITNEYSYIDIELLVTRR